MMGKAKSRNNMEGLEDTECSNQREKTLVSDLVSRVCWWTGWSPPEDQDWITEDFWLSVEVHRL